ncbi:MAG: bifunctional riboflavin kinase/FAD synthetase [Cyclobacteriaceae bacterium]|nr:bifunctional riboflavin kinase/FAD synthetase [Cyclobacteriaceae bacterium HetDA_MAG_MS6]
MEIIDHLEDIPVVPMAVVTSGTFDGVHFGHQKILKKVAKTALELKGQSVVITYWPHPRFVLGKDADTLRLLTTFDEKAALIARTGIDFLVKVPFTREFSELSADEYVKSVLLDKLKTKKFIIGYDHKFGINQSGDFTYLHENQKRFGFEIEEIPRQDIDHVGVSSSKIRAALAEGDVLMANEYLGRNYSLMGIVTRGNQLGREIGFPTANIYLPEEYKLVPTDGSYAVKVGLRGSSHLGMLNIGWRPTVGGRHKTIEVNIFDFDRDIYGQEIHISFVSQLRKEKKFEDIDELKNQLIKDKEEAINILSHEKD